MCDIEILLSMPHPDSPSSEAVAHIDGFAHVLVIKMYATRIERLQSTRRPQLKLILAWVNTAAASP